LRRPNGSITESRRRCGQAKFCNGSWSGPVPFLAVVLAHVELDSGREIQLFELHMESTYGGLIEGHPVARLDVIVAGLPDRAARVLPGAPVQVVEPVRMVSEDPGPGRWPIGPPEYLPPVICMGRFSSSPVDAGLDAVLHYSRLVVVWFQDDPVVPNGLEAVTGLRGVRWQQWAQDAQI
jgi:hypothetical protein